MIQRLRMFTLIGAAVALAAGSPDAAAQAIAKPVTLVVPYAAGGGTDTVARLIGNHMTRTLGQSVVIETVTGAGSTTANERVARFGARRLDRAHQSCRSAGGAQPVPEPALRHQDRLRAGRPRQQRADGADRQEVHPRPGREGARGVDRGQGAKANFAHGGIGTNSHLCAVMMGNALGFKPTFVAYRGSAPAITDLLAGQIDLLWDQVTNALPQIQGGNLHGIAITSTQRLEELKDVPTTAELGMPDLNYTMWHGLYVAKGTPKETIAALNTALRKAVADADIVTRLKQLGSLPFPDKEMSPEAHAQLFAADLPRVAQLIESSGAKPTEAK
jgi:tripartite-type tricarboxylate transporter receptor subunit TctC